MAGPISEIAIAFFDWYGWSPIRAPAAAAAADGGDSVRRAILISLDNSAFSRLYPQSNPRFGSTSASSRLAKSSSCHRVMMRMIAAPGRNRGSRSDFDGARMFRERARRSPGALPQIPWREGEG